MFLTTYVWILYVSPPEQGNIPSATSLDKCFLYSLIYLGFFFTIHVMLSLDILEDSENLHLLACLSALS